MSGILGLVNWNGAPVEADSLESMATAGAHRGPDGTDLWHEGNVGFGYLALRLTPESLEEVQPLARGGLVLVADARIDNREELLALLHSRGWRQDRPPVGGAHVPTDADLILAAYRSWGSACVAHLEGDFAFAIWDEGRREVFAARDPMGLRPLYYREEPGRFLFASEVKQILAAPGVPRRIHEPALLAHVAGPYGRLEWSFFRGIDQLAPGHTLTAREGGSQQGRYWDVDPEARIRYRSQADYGEHFRELFQEAVSCRLRSQRPLGLLLSGGVDSGSIASMAGWLLERGAATPPGFRAYSWAFDELRDGDERGISDVIVDRYGLARTDVPADEGWPLQGYPEHGPDLDDPWIWPYQGLHDRSLDRARSEGMGAVFTGDRGDEVLGDWVHDFPGLFLSGRWRLLGRELRVRDRSLRKGFVRRVLRPLLRGGTAHEGVGKTLAPWVRREAAARWDLTELVGEAPEGPRFDGRLDHGARQLRHGRIFSVPGMRIAVANERRCAARGLGFADPWSDARIARFILAIPQWRVNLVSEPKRLARQGLKGVIPEEVRMRIGKTIPHGLFERGFMDRSRETVRELIRDSMVEEMGLMDGKELRGAYEDFLKGVPPRHDFWAPLTAEMWLREHWR